MYGLDELMRMNKLMRMNTSNSNGVTTPTLDAVNSRTRVVKKGRGRPKKNGVAADIEAPTVKRGRGRPKKMATITPVEAKPVNARISPALGNAKTTKLTTAKPKKISHEELKEVKELLMRAVSLLLM